MAKKPLEEIFNVDGKGEPSQDEANNEAANEANDRNGIGGVDNMVAREQLRTIVERVERLAEEKKAITDDITAVYAEASANGFDAKILRQVVALRKKDPTEREEEDAQRDLYMLALGMLPDIELEEDE